MGSESSKPDQKVHPQLGNEQANVIQCQHSQNQRELLKILMKIIKQYSQCTNDIIDQQTKIKAKLFHQLIILKAKIHHYPSSHQHQKSNQLFRNQILLYQAQINIIQSRVKLCENFKNQLKRLDLEFNSKSDSILRAQTIAELQDAFNFLEGQLKITNNQLGNKIFDLPNTKSEKEESTDLSLTTLSDSDSDKKKRYTTPLNLRNKSQKIIKNARKNSKDLLLIAQKKINESIQEIQDINQSLQSQSQINSKQQNQEISQTVQLNTIINLNLLKIDDGQRNNELLQKVKQMDTSETICCLNGQKTNSYSQYKKKKIVKETHQNTLRLYTDKNKKIDSDKQSQSDSQNQRNNRNNTEKILQHHKCTCPKKIKLTEQCLFYAGGCPCYSSSERCIIRICCIECVQLKDKGLNTNYNDQIIELKPQPSQKSQQKSTYGSSNDGSNGQSTPPNDVDQNCRENGQKEGNGIKNGQVEGIGRNRPQERNHEMPHCCCNKKRCQDNYCVCKQNNIQCTIRCKCGNQNLICMNEDQQLQKSHQDTRRNFNRSNNQVNRFSQKIDQNEEYQPQQCKFDDFKYQHCQQQQQKQQ